MKIYEGDGYIIRPVEATDESEWRRLWAGYRQYFGITISEFAIDRLWQRLIDPRWPVSCFVAAEQNSNELLAIGHYVLHVYTWGIELVCYFEDMFIVEKARNRKIGRKMILHLCEEGREQGWAQVYWNVHETNVHAQAMHNSIIPAELTRRYVVKTKP